MTKVHLKGRLGKEFGELWQVDVKTPKEALHAINVNTDGRFARYLESTTRDRQIGYAFMIGEHAIDSREKVEMFTGPIGSNEDIVVTPIVGGSGGLVEALIINLVIAIITAVVSAMLAPSPTVDLGSNSDTARKDSYLFSGGPQPAKQGKPVPVGYGRMIVYPIAISVQYEYSSRGTGSPAAGFISNPDTSYNNWGDAGGYYNNSEYYVTPAMQDSR